MNFRIAISSRMNNRGIFHRRLSEERNDAVAEHACLAQRVIQCARDILFLQIIPRLGVEYGDPGARADRRCVETVAADFGK